MGENTYRIDRPYQSVLHRLLKLRSDFRAGEHHFTFQFARQFDHRQEYDIVRNQALGSQLNLRILTYTEDASWEHPKLGNLQGSVGLSAMQQDNWYSGRYFIPNYTAYTYGAYWLEKWIKNKWELQGGFRYDNKTVNTIRVKSDNSQVLHAFDFATVASSLNADYKINKQQKLNAGISLSSRAPYVNELLSDGIHQGDGVYYLGDINLKTERAVNFLANYSFDNTANTFSAQCVGLLQSHPQFYLPATGAGYAGANHFWRISFVCFPANKCCLKRAGCIGKNEPCQAVATHF